MTNIAVFVGSLREGSINKKLAAEMARLAPEGVEFTSIDFSDWPLYNHDNEHDYPANIQLAKEIVAAADGVLFVTPEYNRSIPGALKNAIDWLSRPSDSNPFVGKQAAVSGASGGRWGTTFAQTQLKSVLLYFDMKVMGQPELYINGAHEHFSEDGRVVGEGEPYVKEYIETFVARIEG